MASEKVETIVAGNYLEMEREEGDSKSTKSRLSALFWHGGSVYDAWFSCASNQVAQVLLTLPYSFSQLGMLSGILFQLFYGLMGSWTAYLISVLYVEYRTRKEREKVDFRNHVIQWFEVLDGLLGKHWRNVGLLFNCTFLLFGSVIQLIACASNIYYINDNFDKRTWTYIFGACCATTVFIPSFHNYRIWSFLGLMMTTYTSWYLTIASFIHGQVEGVKHSGPTKMVLYFTGATNILYTFGGHAVTVEIMHAMWKPQRFKLIYLTATLYVLTLTLPSASAVYWAFGDMLLNHSNAFSLLPRSGYRDTAVILMLIHQFITFGFACTPLYFVWEKFVGVHDTKSVCKRALARLPVVIPIWFLAIIFPFFGPINSTVGSLLVSFTVYIIPALAHMITFSSPSSRENAVERPPSFLAPLQARLDKLTSSIGKVGLAVAFLVLVVLLIRYFTGHTEDENGQREYNGSDKDINDVLNSVVNIVAAAVTIIVVAIPEGLPLAVTLTLAYSMKRMMADHAMVRKLSACETMGSATIICTDKTGTLTMNQMKVTKFWLGQEEMGEIPSNAITPCILELFRQGVGLNTTGSVYRPASGAVFEFSGSPTEKAILSWAVQELGMDVEQLKQTYSILHVETFNSEKKRSGVSMRKNADNTIHVHWKGAAEMVLQMCSNYYETSGTIKSMDEDSRMQLEKIIQGMAASSLRCIAFAYKQISEAEIEYNDDGRAHQKLNENGLTLLGIVGLKDPCRPGVKRAVEICKSAGVEIKMITGDNVFTAKAIATECGILGSDDTEHKGAVVEGVEFRNYTHEERMQKIDKIRVMARSSPFDKLLMVQCLKQKGEVVAVTGDGTNDAPALKEADIGLSMGIQGTEVAKESSDIVILDDNFTSVATVLRWGRCVYNNIQKFIQFQLTVNVAALVINFISAVSAGEVPLTAVQLLWVNLIMDTLGALALATDRPTNELMQRPPVGRTEPLITNVMWRNLLAQALYQIAVLLTLQFKGESIFNVDEKVNDTLIFNTFVLCQVFNEFNARKLEKQNVFKGIHKNKLFLGIVGFTIVLQVVMVEFLKKFADTVNLNGLQWAICIAIAAVSWPIGWIVKFIPVSDKPFLSYLKWAGQAFGRIGRGCVKR